MVRWTLTYYFQTGEIMEGKWIFNRESGQLWGTGNFKNNKKHGEWIRYDKKGEKEYHVTFPMEPLAKSVFGRVFA